MIYDDFQVVASSFEQFLAQLSKLILCYVDFISSTSVLGDRGSTVVKELCYKSEDRWFDPTWCQ